VPPERTFTDDSIYRGAVRVVQPRAGHRFSVDALQLAHFAARSRYGRVLDLGTGCGVIALALVHRLAGASAVGVELQPDLAEAARRGAAANGLGARFEVVEGDLRQAVSAPRLREAFDLVVANPPYHDPAAGPVSPRAGRAAARHQLQCTLAEVIAAARRACAPRGRVALIVATEGLPDVFAALPRDLRPTALRLVHPRAGLPARRALIEARRGVRTPLRVLAPLYVHDDRGWSAEMREVLGEE
jgi:tRNA1(Val) A37 N6-methylase TrmN6